MRYFNVFSIACLPVALSLAACSAKEDPPAGCFSFDYANYMASTTPTLDANVMPIFVTCAVAVSCHGGGAHPPNLGGMQNGAPVSSATVKTGLLNVDSTEVPLMKYVVPGKPKDSYLMRKVESPNPGCGLMCTPPVGVANGCSTRMPSGVDEPLPAAQVTTIRDWIKSGAN